jgi:tetratricopeptide (TPR) repeat protein
MAAARKAKAAHDLHEEVLKRDPAFHDARASVGIYDYVVASIPGILRYTILLPLGLHGDGKKVGIERLEEAAAKGKRASVDAKMLLVVVYNREGQYAKSLKLIDELHARYPRNFMFEISKASIYQKQKNWAAAIQTYKRIAENVHDRKNGYERLRLEKVYYELGNSQIHGMQFDDAATTFAKVVAGEKASPSEKAVSHLWMGKMLDSKYQVTRDPRQRADAVEHYRAVEKLNCDANLKKEARTFLRHPFVSK